MNEIKSYTCRAHHMLSVCILLCYMELMILGINHVDTAYITSESDERKTLEQALFLVELLKSDYVRALRENPEIKNNGEESQTCATTNIPVRRHNYNEDYGYNENAGGLRRFYDDVFGPQPGNTNTRPTTTSKTNILNTSPSTNTQSITTTTSSATTAATTTTSTSITTKVTSNVLTESSSSPVITKSTKSAAYYTTRATTSKTSTTTNTPKTVTIAPTSIKRVPQKKHLSFSKTTHEATSNILSSPTAKHNVPHVYTTSQPVKPTENIDKSSGQELLNKLHTTQKPDTVGIELSQAAAEFEKEFDVDFPNVLKHKSQKLSVSWRGSTRVHLAGSTRYPIPLPENNAFCYTNPKSALCRTFI